MFVSPVFPVPLISLQPNCVCLFTVPNIVTTRLSAFKMGISTGKNTVTCSIKTHLGGGFLCCSILQQPMFIYPLIPAILLCLDSWYAACMCIVVLLNGGEGE